MKIERNASYLVSALVAAGLVAAPMGVDSRDEAAPLGVDAGTVAGEAGETAPNLALDDPDPIVLAPEEIEWREGPPSIPAGAEAAVLEGDPSAEGEIFVFRIRFPAGYTLPPHFHPVDERVTVISGTFHLGMGRTLDRDRGRALSAGSQFLMPPGHAHYAWTEDEGAVIQLTSIGPWQIEYVDRADDPRLQGNGR